MTHTAPEPTGLAVLELAQAGRFDQIRELFAPQLRAMTSPPRTGWTCVAMTRPRRPRRWASPSSSSRAAVTTR